MAGRGERTQREPDRSTPPSYPASPSPDQGNPAWAAGPSSPVPQPGGDHTGAVPAAPGDAYAAAPAPASPSDAYAAAPAPDLSEMSPTPTEDVIVTPMERVPTRGEALLGWAKRTAQPLVDRVSQALRRDPAEPQAPASSESFGWPVEETPNESPASTARRRLPPALMALVALLAVIAGVLFLAFVVGAIGSLVDDETAEPLRSTPPSPEPSSETYSPAMPALEGQSYWLAEHILGDLWLYEIDAYDASDAARQGPFDSGWKVCSQEPAAGTKILYFEQVSLAVVMMDEPCPGEPTPSPSADVTGGEPLTEAQLQAAADAQRILSLAPQSRAGLTYGVVTLGSSLADATVGVDSLGVDWDAQAVAMAKDYVFTLDFTHQELVEQLIFEGFTAQQAEAATTSIGL